MKIRNSTTVQIFSPEAHKPFALYDTVLQKTWKPFFTMGKEKIHISLVVIGHVDAGE
jgi:hypothetical protein